MIEQNDWDNNVEGDVVEGDLVEVPVNCVCRDKVV